MKACASWTNICLCYTGKICRKLCINKGNKGNVLGFHDLCRNCRGQMIVHPTTKCHSAMALPLQLPSLKNITIVQVTPDRFSTLCYPAAYPGPGFLQFSFDICQCSEIYFKHQLTLSEFPGGIFADKIGWLAHHPWMSGGNQSQRRWLTQGSVPWSVRNNNRLWEGIQSESGLMILIQAATSDKAPMLFTASRSPHRNSLLITGTKIKLILLCQFNATVILIKLFPSNLLSQWVWSSPCKVIALQFIAEGTLWKCRFNQNKSANFSCSSWV